MTGLINEKVSVVTVFDHQAPKNVVLPWKIKWHGRIYTVHKLGYHHTLREGRKLLHIFSVTDGNLDFRLRLDTETLHWTLEEICDGTAH